LPNGLDDLEHRSLIDVGDRKLADNRIGVVAQSVCPLARVDDAPAAAVEIEI